MATSPTPNQQGDAFEANFGDLIGRLICGLGYDLVSNRRQPPGPQHGKDIQTRWRADGDEVFWQFECKSHRSGSLKGKEVADKLFDLMRSSHRVDVWCLVLANVEPGQWIDETFAWAREHLDLRFELETLSPSQRDIKKLFACEPDLFRSQYPNETCPDLDAAERESVLDAFRLFLDGATARGRANQVDRRAAWQVVARSRMAGPDNPDAAEAYLRGVAVTAPWEAVAHAWAVWRASSVDYLVDRIHSAPIGFDFAWLVAAGGEGKTTVMRQVAWAVAADELDWTVFWTEAELRGTEAPIPVDMIEDLSAGANVLICVDGSEGLVGVRRLRAMSDRFAGSAKRIFVLLADRGLAWNRSKLPGQLSRGLRHIERRLPLERLDEAEAKQLVEELRKRSLLSVRASDATAELSRAGSSGPWLLPTLMQLTDPQNRGFEGILASVLSGLRTETSSGPLLLLLTASVVQASGPALPQDIAERLVDAKGGFVASMEALTAELESQFRVPREIVGLGAPPRTVVTHHRVIAEGFVSVAAKSSEFSKRFLEVCEELPQTVRQDVSVEELIPRPRFQLLDGVLRYLLSFDPPMHEAADCFLRSLVTIDRRQFPALARLADCDIDWLRVELRSNNPDRDLIEWLVESARTACQEGLASAREVLAEGQIRPAPYVNHRIGDEEQLFFHTWGVLEDTVGQIHGDIPTLKRAVMLFLQSGSDRALSTLPLALMHLGEPGRAAKAAAAFRAVGTSKRDREIVKTQRGMLQRYGHVVPETGIEIIDDLWPDLAINLLLMDWTEIGLYERRDDHVAALRLALRKGAARVSPHVRIDEAMAILES
jgi:hypothetical protein